MKKKKKKSITNFEVNIGSHNHVMSIALAERIIKFVSVMF